MITAQVEYVCFAVFTDRFLGTENLINCGTLGNAVLDA